MANFIHVSCEERRRIISHFEEIHKRLSDIEIMLSEKLVVYVPDDDGNVVSDVRAGVASMKERNY